MTKQPIHFDDHPMWSELAAEHAVKTFGDDWEENVRLDVSMVGRGAVRRACEFNGWAMRWWKSGTGDKERFSIATSKKDRNENLSPAIPAMVEYDYDGVLRSRSFCTNGFLQDPELVVAALESYYPNGSLKSRDYYKKGKFNDPNPEIPASVEYHDNGTIAAVTYRIDGDRTDRPDGTPAFVNYDRDGIVIRGHSSQKGGLDAAEVMQIMDKARAASIRMLCGNAVGVVAPLAGGAMVSTHIVNDKNISL